VGVTNFGAVRAAVGSGMNLATDSDDDNDVDASDYGRFRPRFGTFF
jgi:hypothetical protein